MFIMTSVVRAAAVAAGGVGAGANPHATGPAIAGQRGRWDARGAPHQDRQGGTSAVGRSLNGPLRARDRRQASATAVGQSHTLVRTRWCGGDMADCFRQPFSFPVSFSGRVHYTFRKTQPPRTRCRATVLGRIGR